MILARKIVTLSKAQLDGRSVAFGILYRFYVGTHNENHPFIEQKRVFDSLGEDLGWRNKTTQRQFMKVLWRKGGASFWAAGCGVIRAQGLAPMPFRDSHR